jgi:hypothetical protein
MAPNSLDLFLDDRFEMDVRDCFQAYFSLWLSEPLDGIPGGKAH